MKRYLRHKKTGRWIAPDGSHTTNVGDALEVQEIFQAQEFCATKGLNDIEVVIQFDADPQNDVIIPIWPRRFGGSSRPKENE